MTDTEHTNGQPDEGAGADEQLDRDLTGILEALREKVDEAGPAAPPRTEAVWPLEAAEPAPESEEHQLEPEPEPAQSGLEPAQSEPEPELAEEPAAEAAPALGYFGRLLEPSDESATVASQPSMPFAPVSADESPWADGGSELLIPADTTAVLPPIVDAARNVDMGPAKRSRWWVWVLVALGVCAVLGAGGYAWWWSTSRPVIAPDVVGKKPAEATQTLNDVGLRLGKVSEIPTDSAPVGTIISQNPEAGTRLKPAATLSFVVAAAPEQAKVPNVVGVAMEAAAAQLAEARLRPFEVASYNTTVAAGSVIAQLPAAGTEIAPGTAIAVVVSKGPAPASATVPRITGMSQADAITLLKAVGLQARVYQSPDASLAAGVVGTQTPLPGVSAAPGSVVQVLVTQPAVASPVTVPDVANKSRAAAVADLKAKGLKAQVVVVSNATVARGKVISQMPLAGGRCAPGGVVGLLVSRGNVNDGPVPSVVGTASAEATKVVTAGGFRPVMIEVAVEGQTPGTVFAQYPAAGTTYAFRFPVVCLVAKSPGM